MTVQASNSMTGGEADWRWLFKAGGVAAVGGVALMPLQIIVYAISPPPTTVTEWFSLLHGSPFLGLLNLDLLYLVNNLLLIPIYLALYAALKPAREPVVLTALILGLVGVAAYVPSNPAFEMLQLSQLYTTAAEAEQALVLAAGQALVVQIEGTAFLVYYVLNALALLLFAAVMLRSRVFSRNTAYAGLTAGLLMVVPSNLGTIGLIFAFASLLPWALFSILIARRLLRPGRG